MLTCPARRDERGGGLISHSDEGCKQRIMGGGGVWITKPLGVGGG
jgi:hypothetical protein